MTVQVPFMNCRELHRVKIFKRQGRISLTKVLNDEIGQEQVFPLPPENAPGLTAEFGSLVQSFLARCRIPVYSILLPVERASFRMMFPSAVLITAFPMPFLRRYRSTRKTSFHSPKNPAGSCQLTQQSTSGHFSILESCSPKSRTCTRYPYFLRKTTWEKRHSS